MANDTLHRTLGWASLGLGAANLAATRHVARLAGVDDAASAPAVIRAVGARELVHAAGLLGGTHKRVWAFTRVLGDTMDLAVLAKALRNRDAGRRARTIAVTAAVTGIGALDLVAALSSRRRGADQDGHVHASVTVNAPAVEAYAYWRDLANLPSFMDHVVSVEKTGATTSRWTAKAPGGKTVTWDAELTEDSRGRAVAWRSLPGATVPNSGRVTFTQAPGDRGTEVHVELEYEIPGGRAGSMVARMFGEEPAQQVRDDLRRFKQVMETGEVVRSDGTPEGVRAGRLAAQQPAQPVRV
jgi:uncharacterized membrane protein